MAESVREGEEAPDFELPDQDGRPVRLSSYRGAPLVLYFYPSDFTVVCTREACSFRDQAPEFDEAGAPVVGVSRNGVGSHRAFADRYQLPFTLLSDQDGVVHRRYGAGGILRSRVTFVLDAEGRVRRRIESRLRAEKHVNDAVEALRALQAEASPRAPLHGR